MHNTFIKKLCDASQIESLLHAPGISDGNKTKMLRPRPRPKV